MIVAEIKIPRIFERFFGVLIMEAFADSLNEEMGDIEEPHAVGDEGDLDEVLEEEVAFEAEVGGVVVEEGIPIIFVNVIWLLFKGVQRVGQELVDGRQASHGDQDRNKHHKHEVLYHY